MATVTLRATQVEGMRSAGLGRVVIECDMTPTDMRSAFGEFLSNITEAELAEWMKEFGLEQAGAA